MGTVYEAMQEEPRRSVALKIMKRGIASRSALRRFKLESQILARLQHPNIAQIYEAGTHDDDREGVPYFVMEYISSAKTLTEYSTDKGLGTRERLALFSKVCDAVQHGHLKGIIHRDLKPSNILVDANGQPKIIDFGVARSTDSDMAVTTLQTDVGQLIGTLQYMSPEQCEADPSDIDARSDVYALGVTLYELLAGRPPYNVRKVAIHEAIRILLEEEPTSLSSFGKHLRGDIETISKKSLEKNRDHRYQSVIALNEDIQRYLDGEQISARPIGKTSGWLKRGIHLNWNELGFPVPSLKTVLFLLAFCVCLFGTLYSWALSSSFPYPSSGLMICACPLVGLSIVFFLTYFLSSKSSDDFSTLGNAPAKYWTALKLLLFTAIYCAIVYLIVSGSLPKNYISISFSPLFYVCVIGPYVTIVAIWLVVRTKMSTKKLVALVVCLIALIIFSLILFAPPSDSADDAGLAHPIFGEDVVVFGNGTRAYLIADDVIYLPDEDSSYTYLPDGDRSYGDFKLEANVIGNFPSIKFELLDWNGDYVGDPVTKALTQQGTSKSPRGECHTYIGLWDLKHLYQDPRVMAIRTGEVSGFRAEQLHFTVRMTVESEQMQTPQLLKEVEVVFPEIYAAVDVTHNLGEVIDTVPFDEFLRSGNAFNYFEGIGDSGSTRWKFPLDGSQDLRVTVSLRDRGISPTQIKFNVIKTSPVRHQGSSRAKIGDTVVYGDTLHTRIIVTKQSAFPLDIFYRLLKSGNYIFEFIGTMYSSELDRDSKTTDSFYVIVEDDIDTLFRQVFTAIGHPMSEELWADNGVQGKNIRSYMPDWHYIPSRTSDCGLCVGQSDLSDELRVLIAREMDVYVDGYGDTAVFNESRNRIILLNYAKAFHLEGDLIGLQWLLDSLNSVDSISRWAILDDIYRKREEDSNVE
jgi:serine/threonine protein kinase